MNSQAILEAVEVVRLEDSSTLTVLPLVELTAGQF